MKDYDGVYNMTCKKYMSKVYNMPHTINIGGCTQLVWGKHICDEESIYCNSLTSILLSVFGLSLFLISWIILCKLRFTVLRNDKIKHNIDLKGPLYNLTITVDNHKHKISLIRVILYLMFGLSLSNACLIPQNDGLFMSTQGDVICTTKQNISLPHLYNEIITNKLYNTYLWKLSLSLDWGCAGGACPSIDDCNDQDNYKFSLKEENVWVKRVCKSYAKGCFMGRGCIFGYANLHVSNKFNVYKVTGINQHHINVLKTEDCEFHLHSNNNYKLGSYAIVQGLTSWLCPGFSIQMSSELNTLGDLQEYNNSISFPWDSLNCDHNWYKTNCEIPLSFISSISDRCEEIPGYTTLGFIEQQNSKYVIRGDNNYIVEGYCHNNVKIIENTICVDFKVELWGVRDHATGIYLAAKAFSMQAGQSMIFTNPCTNEQLILSCDGLIHYYVVSENNYNSCINLTDKTFSGTQYFVTKYYSEPEFTISDKISSLSSSYLGLFSSVTGSGIIWLVIIILLLKK